MTTQIIAFHSFRRGTGKSTLAANMAYLMARTGKRVAIVDSNIQSPSMHILMGLPERDIEYTLNHYLWQECDISQIVYPLDHFDDATDTGKLWLIPASTSAPHITRIIRDGFELSHFNECLYDLVKHLNLDVLIVDTNTGLMDAGAVAIAISDLLIVVLRPDHQDYYGTGLTVDVATKLAIPKILLMVNETPRVFDETQVRDSFEGAYNVPVLTVLPFCNEMMATGSMGLFVQQYPSHAVTVALRKAVQTILF